MTPDEALQDIANTVQFLVATRDQLVRSLSMVHQSMQFQLGGLAELSKIVAAAKEKDKAKKTDGNDAS